MRKGRRFGCQVALQRTTRGGSLGAGIFGTPVGSIDWADRIRSRPWPRIAPSPEPPIRGHTLPVKHGRATRRGGSRAKLPDVPYRTPHVLWRLNSSRTIAKKKGRQVGGLKVGLDKLEEHVWSSRSLISIKIAVRSETVAQEATRPPGRATAVPSF